MAGNDFINAIVSGLTDKSLQATRDWLRELELDLGRVRTAHKFSDRTIDLDLLLYGDTNNQFVPHPEITEQAYVLQPLYDISPSLIHPALKKTVSEIKSQLLQSDPQKFAALEPVTLDL